MAATNQDMQAVLDRLKTQEQRADAAEKAVKDGCDRVAVLEKTLNEVNTKLAAADKARLDSKRTELRALLGREAKDTPELDTATEAVLDAWISREKADRGRADGTRIIRSSGDARKTLLEQDGMLVHEGGFTVTNHKNLLAAKGREN